ncbi:MAG: N-acyl homoserine lactonase family protein [Candidatus Korobacteraceae bacterium]|jgi:glyoxylase-like metal-dependent hydrolase (beta-lactamase superfamily II)
MGYKIIPLNTGIITVDRGAYCTMGRGIGQKVDIPSTAWYVSDGREHLLVDTGMCDTARANRWHHEGFQPPGGRIDQQLMSRAGVAPEEITAILFTHLHWDHCSNMKLFPNARYYVQARELEFALDPPLPPYYRSYEAPILGLESPFAGCKFITRDGEWAYNDDITLFPTPGHSVGHQSVAVRTEAGPVIIAGDAVFVHENLKGDPEHLLEFIPIGRYINYFEMWNSFKEIKRRGGLVLPGHDNSVFDRPCYP